MILSSSEQLHKNLACKPTKAEQFVNIIMLQEGKESDICAEKMKHIHPDSHVSEEIGWCHHMKKYTSKLDCFLARPKQENIQKFQA